MRYGGIWIVICAMIVTALPGVIADTYPIMGGEDYNYQSIDSTSWWNTAMTTSDYTVASKAFDSPEFMPLASDIDNDGDIEIIARDGCTIKVYSADKTVSPITLDIESSISIPRCPSYPLSNIEINDIDSDGYEEIIIADAKTDGAYIMIFEHNGSTLTNQTYYSCKDSRDDYNEMEEVAIRCTPDGRCIRVMTHRKSATQKQMSTMPFDDSYCYTSKEEFDTITSGMGMATTDIFVLPAYGGIYVGDVDVDTEYEFVIGTLEVYAGNERYWMIQLDMDSSLNITGITRNYRDVEDIVDAISTSMYANGTSFRPVDQPVHKLFSAPIALDIDANSGNGLEIIFAVMDTRVDAASPGMKQYAWKQDNSEHDDYPETGRIAATYVGNPMEARGFDDIEEGEGWCTTAYNLPDESLIVHCCTDSGYTSSLTEDRSFDYDYSGYAGGAFNITEEYLDMTFMTHAIDVNGVNENLEEILTPYGVFELDPGVVDDNADLIFKVPYDAVTVIPTSVDNSNFNDLVLIHDNAEGTALRYLDDGFTNSAGEISYYTVDPCLESPWQQNTTVQVRVTVDDYDSDTVAARAILYYGDTFFEDAGDEVTVYDALKNETESAGSRDGQLYAFGDRVPDGNISSYFLMKDAQTGIANRIYFNVTSLAGTPQADGFEYDLYVCITSASSLGTNPISQCLNDPVQVTDNFPVSNQWGSSAGIKYIEFDTPYPFYKSYSYIIHVAYAAGGGDGSDWYYTSVDTSPSNNYIALSYIEGSGVNATYSYIDEMRLGYVEEPTINTYDTGWSSYSSAGSTFTFNFIADEIGDNEILRLMGRDSANPEQNDTIDLTYTVAYQGVEFGECYSAFNVTGAAEGAGDVPTDEDDVTDNPIKNAIDVTQDEMGFTGLSHSTIWILFMLLIALAVWFTPMDNLIGHSAAEVKFGMIGLVEVIMLLLGVRLDFLGAGTIITVILIVIAALAVVFRRKTLGG